MENQTIDSVFKAVKEIGPVPVMIFLFIYIVFWRIVPILRDKDKDLKELNEKFIQSTTQFNDAISKFTLTLQEFKKEIVDKLEANSDKIHEIFRHVTKN